MSYSQDYVATKTGASGWNPITGIGAYWFFIEAGGAYGREASAYHSKTIEDELKKLKKNST